MQSPRQIPVFKCSKTTILGQFPGFECRATETNEKDWVVKASLAHLWFVTIHPFDDGSGRIARAIADMDLARRNGVHSASTACRRRSSRNGALTTIILSRLSAARWISRIGWDGFSTAYGMPSTERKPRSRPVLVKARFRESIAAVPLNERQKLVLNPPAYRRCKDMGN
jgi:hypothetical protein